MIQRATPIRVALRFGLLALFALTSACSRLPALDQVLPDRRTEYRKAESLPDLEVPPDLSTTAIGDRMPIPETDGDTATYSTYQQRVARQTRQRELASTQNAAIQVLESETVLAVEGALVQVWPQLQSFWAGLGYDLAIDDEDLGVMETSWRENSEALTRDKFKVFAEAGTERGTTVLYVSHVAEAMKPSGEGLAWTSAPRDEELERRLVDRIAEEFGGGPSGASVADTEPTSAPTAGSTGYLAAEIVSAGGGKVYLNVAGDFLSVWDETGTALNNARLEIGEADTARGLYVIQLTQVEGAKKDGKGFFGRLKFWGDDDKDAEVDPSVYQVSVTNVGERTEIVVLDSTGTWATTDDARDLINLLHKHFEGRAS